MSTSSIAPILAAAAPAAYAPATYAPSTATNVVASPDGSTVTVVRDQNQNIVSIAATPATFPASTIALASNQATGTSETGLHLIA